MMVMTGYRTRGGTAGGGTGAGGGGRNRIGQKGTGIDRGDAHVRLLFIVLSQNVMQETQSYITWSVIYSFSPRLKLRLPLSNISARLTVSVDRSPIQLFQTISKAGDNQSGWVHPSSTVKRASD